MVKWCVEPSQPLPIVSDLSPHNAKQTDLETNHRTLNTHTTVMVCIDVRYYRMVKIFSPTEAYGHYGLTNFQIVK